MNYKTTTTDEENTQIVEIIYVSGRKETLEVVADIQDLATTLVDSEQVALINKNKVTVVNLKQTEQITVKPKFEPYEVMKLEPDEQEPNSIRDTL